MAFNGQQPRRAPLLQEKIPIKYGKDVFAGQKSVAIRAIHLMAHSADGPEITQALSRTFTANNAETFVTRALYMDKNYPTNELDAELRPLDKRSECTAMASQWYEASTQSLKKRFENAAQLDFIEERPYHHLKSAFETHVSTIDVDPGFIYNNIDDNALKGLRRDEADTLITQESKYVSAGWAQRLLNLFQSSSSHFVANQDYAVVDESTSKPQNQAMSSDITPSSRSTSIYLNSDLLLDAEKMGVILNEPAVIAAIQVFLNQVPTNLSVLPSAVTGRSRHVYYEIIGFASVQDWLEGDNDYFFTKSRYNAFMKWMMTNDSHRVISGFYSIQQYETIPFAETSYARRQAEWENAKKPLFYLPQAVIIQDHPSQSIRAAPIVTLKNITTLQTTTSDQNPFTIPTLASTSFLDGIQRNVENLKDNTRLPIALAERTLLDMTIPTFHFDEFKWSDLKAIIELGMGGFGLALSLDWQGVNEADKSATLNRRPSKHFHHRLIEYLLNERINVLNTMDYFRSNGDNYSVQEISRTASASLKSFTLRYSGANGQSREFSINAAKSDTIAQYETAEKLIKAVQRHDLQYTAGDLSGVITKPEISVTPLEYEAVAHVRIVTKLVRSSNMMTPSSDLISARQELMANMLAYFGNSDKMSDHLYWNVGAQKETYDLLEERGNVNNPDEEYRVGSVQFDRTTNDVVIMGVIRTGFYVTLSELVIHKSPYLLARIAQLVQKGQLIPKKNERFDLVLAPASQWRNEVIMPTFGSSYSNEFFIGVQPLMNNGSFWNMIQLQYEVTEVYQEAANRGDAQSLFEFAEELNLMSTNAQVDALLKHKEAQSIILRQERRPLTQYETLRILRDLVRAIQCISSQGFVHRDVKPDNVLVDGLRRVGRLADFGLMAVKGSPFTGPAGTLYYMPEVIVTEQGRALISPTAPLVDSLLDIYALGKSIEEAFEFYSSNELSGSVVTPLILRSLVSDSTDNVTVKLASANVFYSPDRKIDVAKAPITREMSETIVDTMNALAKLLTDEKYAQQWKADTTPIQRELKNYYAAPSLLVVAESTMTILMACVENECMDRWGPANIIV